MSEPMRDTIFTDAISACYERHLVPLIFEPYAELLARRVAVTKASQLLEIAAGTGVLTRALAELLPPAVSITATDLNQTMLDQAAHVGTSRPVTWRRANALELPFDDASFDVVACQFGVMFFPDKAAAFAEARRVLRPGGVFMFSVWDRIEDNEFADVVTSALRDAFPHEPPRFLARTPHGYHDTGAIARDLALGGFASAPEFETVAARSVADSAHGPAIAYCHGTPLRNEIAAHDASRLDEVTTLAADAIRRRWGSGRVEAKIQAHLVVVSR